MQRRFYGCGKLSNVVVPSTVTAISAGLFTSKEDYPGLSGNFDCNFIVESGSCAETALKAFSVKDWNKTYTLKVITAGENECKFSETDQRYLRYLDYEELEDGTLSVRNKHPFPEDVTVLEIPDELLGKRVSSYTKGQYVIPNQITRITIGAGITHLDLPVPSSYNGQNEALTGIDVSAENPNYWSDGLAVYSKDRSCFVRMVSTQAESYVLHPDTRILSEHAFANLQKLTHLTLNDGLQIIEDNSLGMSMETIDGIEKVPQVSLNGLWRTSWFENQKLLYLGGTLLKCKLTDQKVFTVREGTTCIRENAFSRDLQWGKPNLDALEEIIIPISVGFWLRFVPSWKFHAI